VKLLLKKGLKTPEIAPIIDIRRSILEEYIALRPFQENKSPKNGEFSKELVLTFSVGSGIWWRDAPN
jgi:hypothetical protein